MKFRTEIKCSPGTPQLDHSSSLFLLGSCFSEHMQEKFDYYQFRNFSNPFGILFHPLAIETALRHCVDKNLYEPKDLLEHQGTWISLEHHSQFDDRDQQQVLININKRIDEAHRAVINTSHFIITLGTSWVYEWKNDGRLVGNCHKIPQKYFNKELLSAEEILNCLRRIITLLQSINQQATVIFTVSPVRHLKDGFIENSLSKALLLAAVHDLKKENHNIHYFPAYEILIDDLRDYRFYEKDLVHPNEMAVEYVWNLFKETWISDASKEAMNSIGLIQRSLAHRPFDPESEAHLKFTSDLDLKIERLKTLYPHIDFHKKRK